MRQLITGPYWYVPVHLYLGEHGITEMYSYFIVGTASRTYCNRYHQVGTCTNTSLSTLPVSVYRVRTRMYGYPRYLSLPILVLYAPVAKCIEH